MKTDYSVDVPEGTLRSCEVSRVTVTPQDEEFCRMRAAFSFSSRGRYTPAGVYTQLHVGGKLMMSDTPDEISDLRSVFRFGRGDCLVNGLGLGVVVNGLLLKPEVTSVTAVEINPDVAEFVGRHWKAKYGDRFTVVVDDALTFKPPRGKRFGYVWHDIWPTICGDNLEEMKRLHRRYGRRCDAQGSWGRDLL